MVVAPTLNPRTVEVLLDTTWRVAQQEDARSESLDRKATVLVTFISVVAAIAASAGVGAFVGRANGWWLNALAMVSLSALSAAALLAVQVLRPKEHLALGMAYIERFATSAELRRPPEQVQGEIIQTLAGAMARERELNAVKTRIVRRAYLLLVAALLLLVLESVILAMQR